MTVPREQWVTLTIAIVAILFVVGGFASLSGLSTYEQPLQIKLYKDTFLKSDVFDATVYIKPITMLADETLIISIDNVQVGAVLLKKYLDDNVINYGGQKKIVGNKNVELINTLDSIIINLAEYTPLERIGFGTHTLKVEFSRGNVIATTEFKVK